MNLNLKEKTTQCILSWYGDKMFEVEVKWPGSPDYMSEEDHPKWKEWLNSHNITEYTDEWLEVSIPNPSRSIMYLITNTGFIVGKRFKFKNADDAIRFKLVWG
jgi:hypothetical protein